MKALYPPFDEPLIKEKTAFSLGIQARQFFFVLYGHCVRVSKFFSGGELGNTFLFGDIVATANNVLHTVPRLYADIRGRRLVPQKKVICIGEIDVNSSSVSSVTNTASEFFSRNSS